MTGNTHHPADLPGKPAAGTGPTGDDGGWAIMLFASAVALTATACLDAALVTGTAPRLTVLAAAVAVVAERTAEPRTALASALLAFAIGDGFLQHHSGTLGWNSAIDYPFALGLLFAVALGMCAGQTRLAWRRRQRMRPLVDLLREGAGDAVAAPPGDTPDDGVAVQPCEAAVAVSSRQ